jgi:hypothetical protein
VSRPPATAAPWRFAPSSRASDLQAALLRPVGRSLASPSGLSETSFSLTRPLGSRSYRLPRRPQKGSERLRSPPESSVATEQRQSAATTRRAAGGDRLADHVDEAQDWFQLAPTTLSSLASTTSPVAELVRAGRRLGFRAHPTAGSDEDALVRAVWASLHHHSAPRNAAHRAFNCALRRRRAVPRFQRLEVSSLAARIRLHRGTQSGGLSSPWYSDV